MQTLYAGGAVFDGERMLQGLGVLVEAGRVRRVAPLAEFVGFAGARVDTAGGTLLPGLIDCHVHLCFGAEADPGAAFARLDAAAVEQRVMARAQAALAGGVTALRDCGGAAGPEFRVRDASANANGPTIHACGHIICKVAENGDHVGRIAQGPDAVGAAVDDEAQAGSDFINIMATGAVPSQTGHRADTNYAAEEIAAGLAACHRRGLRSASNAQRPVDIRNVVAGGVTSVELGTWMDEDAARAMVAAGTILVPCLLARQRSAAAGDDARRAFLAQSQAAVRLFHAAGGTIALGTDCGAPGTRHGENAEELALLVAAGLSPLEALRAATAGGAAAMGLADQGRVAAAAAADFLIVDGDPGADIACAANTAHHRMVVKRGVAAGGAAGSRPSA
jgi:imidazolonepropionase-like amidohydrolase